MGEIKNVNLKVASFALNCVAGVKDNNRTTSKDEKEASSKDKKYKTLVKKMAILIQKNGLIGTLAFNISKSDKLEHKLVLDQIIDWSKQDFKIRDLELCCEKNDYTKYIEKLANLNQSNYRLVTKEMMNLFAWIKRFADGMIEGEDQNG